MTVNLQGQTILVTRPDPAGKTLCDLIEAHGGQAIHLPTIVIKPPLDRAAFTKAISQLDQQDWLIFISPQAVFASVQAIMPTWPALKECVKFAAQGEGTAKALVQSGLRADIYPTSSKDSEALLALPVFKSVQGLRIAVIRGEDGRALIGKTLAARGAKVIEVIAYRRERPDLDITPFLNEMKEKSLSAIVSASFESIRNLKTMVGAAGWPYIREVPVLVMSERVKQLTEALHFETVRVIPTANPTSLLKVIAQRGK